jgi:hypothetical protein
MTQGAAKRGFTRVLVPALILLVMLVGSFILAWRLHRVLNTAIEQDRVRLEADAHAFPEDVDWEVHGRPGTDSVCRVVFRSAQVQLDDVGSGYAVRMRGQSGPLPAGSPDLPVFARVMSVPRGYTLALRVIRADFAWATQDVAVAAVAARADGLIDAMQPAPLVRRRSPVVYGSDRFWPDTPVDIAAARGNSEKPVRIAVCPVRYNPVRRELRACREIEFELSLAP